MGIYLGHGDGTFDPPLAIAYFNPQDAAAGDLNQSPSYSNLTVLLNASHRR